MHRALAFGVQGLTAFTWSERPDLAERAEALEAEVWPEYNRHGDVVGAHWGGLREAFSDFQFVVVDEGADELVAEGHSIRAREPSDIAAERRRTLQRCFARA